MRSIKRIWSESLAVIDWGGKCSYHAHFKLHAGSLVRCQYGSMQFEGAVIQRTHPRKGTTIFELWQA